MLVAAGLLLGALGLQFVSFRSASTGDLSSPRRVGHLLTKIPASVVGWTQRDDQLGATEFAQKSAEGLLNYDDYLYRQYSQAGRSFSLYVAYWSPGRMTPARVSGHTPDVCWTGAGWVVKEEAHGYVLRLGKRMLKGGEWRRMELPGVAEQQVLFWQLVDGEPYSTSTVLGFMPSPVDFWRENLRYILGGQPEQYFVRLSSSVPFEELKEDAGFGELVEALEGLRR
jgi:hypothetical protein